MATGGEGDVQERTRQAKESVEIPPPKEVVRVLPSKRGGGYECEFVERPPKAFQADCPVCLLVLREPYQATCCGYSFCKTCITRVQAANTPACPTCNHENFTVFPNKGLQRALSEYEVRCTYRREGCEWVGELGELDKHLNVTPDFDKQLEGCQFAEIECIHCGEPFQRRLVEAHQNDECPRRPFSCDYCRDYGADYEDVVTKHWPVCPCYPMLCPNECGAYLQRQNLEQHASKECPLALVDCDFHYAGCEVKLLRKDMPAHLEQSLVTHVSLLAVHNHKKQVESEALKQEVVQLKRHSEALIQEVARLRHNQEELQSYTGVLPVEFTMTDFEQHKKDGDTWFSPPFYTHPYGYKMCLGVDANGTGEGKGTHVSVFAYLMRGKFDSSLLWPFQGHITVRLLNQLDDNSEHHTYTFVLDRESIGRVTTGERAGCTRGSYKFMSHSDLGHNPAKNCQYLKNDCLCFRVSNVNHINLSIQHEGRWLAAEPSVCIAPIEFTVDSISHQMMEDETWFSPSFYTHPQGYRMCLRVDVNGESTSNAQNPHVSAYVYLMQGQHDNSLKWPFRGKVTIQLLNQLRDSEHYTVIISFTEKTPDSSACRVTNGVRAFGGGLGDQNFIPHTDLHYDPSKNCQYLKHDCLHFRVNKVKLK